jgi:phage tail-like protein
MSVSITANIEGGFYPPSAFYFKVVIGVALVGPDTSFQDVSGISSEMNVEEVVEGGENGYVHKLPRGVKHPNLELKRGIANFASPLVLWCQSVFEGGLSSTIVTMPVSVYLLNEDAIPLRAWVFSNAYPIKWEVESFNSTKNEVAIEKISLSYTTSKRVI